MAKLSGVFLCLALGLAWIPLQAHEGLWSVGIRIQGVADFAPGSDYVNGVEVGYAHQRLLKKKLEFQFAYLTSRLEAVFDNSLRQDWFVLSPVWHFRRTKLFDPTLQLDAGYQRYDIENAAIFGGLENSTWVYGAKAGFGFNFGQARRYSVRYALGFQQSTSPSSYVYTLPFSLGFSASFPRKSP